jgi:hypothetical protein
VIQYLFPNVYYYYSKIAGTQPGVDNATASGGVSITLAKGSNYSSSIFGNGGSFSLTTGAGGNGDTSNSGDGGAINFTTGSPGSNGLLSSSGYINFTTGNATDANSRSGNFVFTAGDTKYANGGAVTDYGSFIVTGGHNIDAGGGGLGGAIVMNGGQSDGGGGGNIYFDGGVGVDDSNSGSVIIGSNNLPSNLVVGFGSSISSKTKTQLFQTGEYTTLNTAAYVNNLSTNTTTDNISKYGLNILSSGSYTGAGGAATKNYSLYINEPTGADQNYSIYLAGTGQTRIIDTASGAYLSNAGVWQDTSNKLMKENYETLNNEDILAKINSLPVEKWNYIIDHDTNIKHIGPYAHWFFTSHRIWY